LIQQTQEAVEKVEIEKVEIEKVAIEKVAIEKVAIEKVDLTHRTYKYLIPSPELGPGFFLGQESVWSLR
jgi:hypothetical protein